MSRSSATRDHGQFEGLAEALAERFRRGEPLSLAVHRTRLREIADGT
jgi:hypothetical protein